LQSRRDCTLAAVYTVIELGALLLNVALLSRIPARQRNERAFVL